MNWIRHLLLVPLCAGLLHAQDDGCEPCDDGCGCDEGESVITAGEGSGEDLDSFDIEIDPTDSAAGPDALDPNRPPAIQVGTWRPGPFQGEAIKRHAELLKAKAARPKDVLARYDLGDFYLKNRWFPQAEQEYLGAAELMPDSIRPWESLLNLYAIGPGEAVADEDPDIVALPGGGWRINLGPRGPARGEKDWLAGGSAERGRRISRSHREILERRPDDLARRRVYVEHLKSVRDHARIVEQARIILKRLPGDADMRFDLAEAVRRFEVQRADAEDREPDYKEAREILERSLETSPDHARSLLRLARIIAVAEGEKAEERIRDLQSRGLFYLLVPRSLAPVAYREDAFRLARDLSGRALCSVVWDRAMINDKPTGERVWRRWIFLEFPRSMASERLQTVRQLGRRGDAAAVGALVGFLWNLWDRQELLRWGQFNGRPRTKEVQAQAELESAAIEAARGMGTSFYPAAERFLKSARTPARRERAVRLMRALGDKRAVEPLVEALVWDTHPQRAFGVAACLEELGDPRAIDALVDAALDVRRPMPRRRECAAALAAFKDPRSMETLTRLAKEPEFRVETMYGLFRLTGEEQYQEQIRKSLSGGPTGAQLISLLKKCDDPAVEGLALHAFGQSPEKLRDSAMALLKERYWKTAQPKVRAILLKELDSPSVPTNTLRYLGEVGGEEAAEKLLKLVESLEGKRWDMAARALADTGDDRAVRYFRKMAILEKDARKRKLAESLVDVALRRALERAKAGAHE